jgi:hypothetical protein
VIPGGQSSAVCPTPGGRWLAIRLGLLRIGSAEIAVRGHAAEKTSGLDKANTEADYFLLRRTKSEYASPSTSLFRRLDSCGRACP